MQCFFASHNLWMKYTIYFLSVNIYFAFANISLSTYNQLYIAFKLITIFAETIKSAKFLQTGYNDAKSIGGAPVRVLKKYPNRRIYDPETSKFVTLVEVRQMVIDRQPIQIIHSKTGNDLTRSVLMQIIAEMEVEGHESLLTNRILEELIRFYGDKMVAMIGPYLEQQILQSLAAQDQLRDQFTQAFSTPYASTEQTIKKMVEQYQAFAGKVSPAPTPVDDDDK